MLRLLPCGFPICFLFLSCFAKHENKVGADHGLPLTESKNVNFSLRLKMHADSLKLFARNHNFSIEKAFLVDMKTPSGKDRFFVYDLKGDSIAASGLVSHGWGSQTENGDLFFTDKPGSLATALGKYSVEAEYYGKFGLAFKMHGLDASNKNAYKRVVVLHAHSKVPEAEIYPQQLCLSWGCPMVNPDFLQKLKAVINGSKKPVLLWIYY